MVRWSADMDGASGEEGSLGAILRRARTEHKLSLRQLAKRIGKTPSYLSDIETDRRVPAEQVMADLGRELGLDLDRLMARAGRLGEQAERYLSRHMLAGLLVRKVAQADLSDGELQQLIEQVERLRVTPSHGDRPA